MEHARGWQRSDQTGVLLSKHDFLSATRWPPTRKILGTPVAAVN